jgi:DNA uptake protein ComE-like DNA-binding protein
VGFSYRKSFKLAPGVRMTVSKSGIGYSVGGKGARVTKRARGGVQTTLHAAGTGLSVTSSSSSATRKRLKPQPADTPPKKMRRREKAMKPRPVDLNLANNPAAVSTEDKRRRSWRRASTHTSGMEGWSTMQEPTPQRNWTPHADQTTQQPRDAHIEPATNSALGLGSTRPHRHIRVAGRWYYVVTIATAGLFAWVPFLHAALRLKTTKARRLALLCGGLDALIYVLLAITPQDSQGQATNGPISTIGGLLALGTIIVGCIMLAPLRRMVYEGAPIDIEDGDQQTVDPAIKAALAARGRRDEARKLATDDPLLARELHIGRPDLTRDYDDGGLIDLNSAPANVIAEVCGIPADVAATIVAALNQRGEPFANVDELFVMTDLPVQMWDRIRDRAVLLS